MASRIKSLLQPLFDRRKKDAATATQKALFLQAKQGEFAVGENKIPKPGSGELLLKLTAVALNPVDWKVQTAGIFVDKYPAILGMDVAGVVEEVGKGVKGFAKGDRVITHTRYDNEHAGFQQYNLAIANFTAKVPSSVTDDEAASIPLGIDTAVIGLFSPEFGGLVAPWTEAGKYNGQTIVVLGGSSSVGLYVIQVAKLAGFSTIIATSSITHEAYLKETGATHVIDRHFSPDDIRAAIGGITKDPIGVVYDAVSLPDTQELGWSLLAKDGKMITTLDPKVAPGEGDTRKVIRVAGIPHLPQNQKFSKVAWSHYSTWLAEGKLVPNRVEVLPNGLEGIVGGLERLKADKVSGTKLVTRPQETP